jgi:hypothetical protein
VITVQVRITAVGSKGSVARIEHLDGASEAADQVGFLTQVPGTFIYLHTYFIQISMLVFIL